MHLKYTVITFLFKMFIILREAGEGRGGGGIPSRLCGVSAAPDMGLYLINCKIMT